LRRNRILKHVVEEKRVGRIKVTGRRRKRRQQLLDDVKKRDDLTLKEEALDHTLWRTGFGRACGSQWGRDFPSVQTDPGAHPASCKMGTGSFPGVEAARAWG